MINTLKKWKDEYTYLVRPKWKFILKCVASIAVIDTIAYFMVFGSPNAVMYHDKWFFFIMLLFNPFLIHMNFREAVWDGYKEYKKNQINAFVSKAIDYKEVFTIAQITALLPEYSKGRFLEAIYNSKLRDSIDASKEDKE